MKIKKIICAAAATAVAMSSAAFAATEDPVKFSTVDEMDGKVYVTKYANPHQGGNRFQSGNIEIHSLPQSMQANRTTFFCCYGDRFYYIDGDVKEVSNLYSCDKEGNDTIVIANNVCGSDDIFIIDNILYYKAYSTKADAGGDDFYGRTYYGGIYKINLATGEWQKVVGDDEALLYFCDGDFIYYTVNGVCYKIDTNGNYCDYADENGDEFGYKYYAERYVGYTWNSDEYGYAYELQEPSQMLLGRDLYFMYDGNILAKKTRNVDGTAVIGQLDPIIQRIYISRVKNGYIYYYYINGEGDYPSAWLYRTER